MIDYKVDHIPIDNYKCTGIKMIPEYITIHSTANPKSTAQNERDWLVNSSNKRQASWHIAVDEKQAIEAVPLDEVAWHAGDGRGPGNTKSIGVEICESGNRKKTVQNAVKIVAKLLKERNWSIGRLRRHYDWSGKNCPRIFSADNWTGWERFKSAVQEELEKPNVDKVKVDINGEIHEFNGFLKNGTNYISIREIANSLGCSVDWKDGMVYIKTNTESEVIESLKLIRNEIDKMLKAIGGE